MDLPPRPGFPLGEEAALDTEYTTLLRYRYLTSLSDLEGQLKKKKAVLTETKSDVESTERDIDTLKRRLEKLVCCVLFFWGLNIFEKMKLQRGEASVGLFSKFFQVLSGNFLFYVFSWKLCGADEFFMTVMIELDFEMSIKRVFHHLFFSEKIFIKKVKF